MCKEEGGKEERSVIVKQRGVVVGVGFFFFQAEDGIRDYKVTGVQTCALPICIFRCGIRLKAFIYCFCRQKFYPGDRVEGYSPDTKMSQKSKTLLFTIRKKAFFYSNWELRYNYFFRNILTSLMVATCQTFLTTDNSHLC